jgi:hypothetical protein
LADDWLAILGFFASLLAAAMAAAFLFLLSSQSVINCLHRCATT